MIEALKSYPVYSIRYLRRGIYDKFFYCLDENVPDESNLHSIFNFKDRKANNDNNALIINSFNYYYYYC